MSETFNQIYNREKAVEYTKRWAYKRNPKYYDFSNVGGDCTNFASQCLYAGCGIMNNTKTFGWYYYSSNNRAPAWTSVKYFYNFLTKNNAQGPYAKQAEINELQKGDFVQIHFNNKDYFSHTPIIVDIKDDELYVAAHSFDCNNRALSSYENVKEFRYIHILGVNR